MALVSDAFYVTVLNQESKEEIVYLQTFRSLGLNHSSVAAFAIVALGWRFRLNFQEPTAIGSLQSRI